MISTCITIGVPRINEMYTEQSGEIIFILYNRASAMKYAGIDAIKRERPVMRKAVGMPWSASIKVC